MALSVAEKARLKRLYLEAAVPYAALVAESGLQRFDFQKLVKNEKWGARPRVAKDSTAARMHTGIQAAEAVPDAAADAPPAAKKRKKKTKKEDAPKPAGLANQMLGAVRIELNKLAGQDGTTSQDRERGSRALMQLMNTLEKAVKMHKKVSKKPGGNKQHKETLKDAETMRREIAERLERLHEQRMAQK